MARKPNYAFERNARAKAKAEKREAKRLAKLAARATSQEPAAASETGDAPPADDVAAGDPASRTESGQTDPT